MFLDTEPNDTTVHSMCAKTVCNIPCDHNH